MAISWDMLRTQHADRPPRIIVHGQPKVGKSSFAAQMPSPLFLCTEEGLGRSELLRNVPAFSIQTYADMMEALTLLSQDTRDFKTLVIDSEDHWEPMVHAEVCRRENKKSIEDIGYGKGYIAACELYRSEYNEFLRYLNRVKGLQICQIAHSQATKVNPPDMTQGFTRWDLKLDRRVSDLLREEADAIWYATIPIVTATVDGGFNSKQTKAVSVGERRLYTQPAGGFLAGSRWAMPEWTSLDWNDVKQYLTGVPGETAKAA